MTTEKNNAFVLESADAILRENGFYPDRNMLLTSSGKQLTSLSIADYSLGFEDNFKKIVSLLPFVRVQKSYSHKILISAI